MSPSNMRIKARNPVNRQSAGIILIVLALLIGYLFGGSESGIKSVMGLGSAQRNIAAALVVAAQNFDTVSEKLVLGG